MNTPILFKRKSLSTQRHVSTQRCKINIFCSYDSHSLIPFTMNECFINYLDIHNSQINHRRHVYCDLESLNHRKQHYGNQDFS